MDFHEVSKGGAPPLEHPRRCQAKRKKGPCLKWALRGQKYCQFHGGRRHHAPVKVDHMPKFYRKHLTHTLNEAVAAQLNTDPKEQVSLFEELALMREHTGQLVKLWSHAIENNAKDELIVACGTEMQMALQEVAKLALAANNIMRTGKDQYSIHDLKYVVMQLTRIMYEVCGEDHENLAQEFERLVDEKLVLPKSPEATDITPDQDVMAMDSTIPQA